MFQYAGERAVPDLTASPDPFQEPALRFNITYECCFLHKLIINRMWKRIVFHKIILTSRTAVFSKECNAEVLIFVNGAAN